uniref:Transmembrane protein n=1 Tax=Strongyloides venezuelensis TaxID=75913 RepID=A0A0K0F754_STRVS
MTKRENKIKVGQRFLTFQEWRFVIVMIHSVLVILKTIFLACVDNSFLTYNINLIIISLLSGVILVLNYPVVNVLYSYGVVFFIMYDYKDIWRKWKVISLNQDEHCSTDLSKCAKDLIEYTFSVANVLTMFYYVIPIFLSIITYSNTLSKISLPKSQTKKKVHFIRQIGKSYPVDEMLNIIFDESNFEREKNAFNIITSKNFQNIIVGQHLPNAKESMSILNYENTKGTQICYINNYTVGGNSDKAKQIFLYTSSGIRWVPETP